MHHVALNWAWSNDRHFNHHIIKTFRLHPRQRGHLRAALDLKHADRVRFLHDLESGGVICRNVREVERPPAFTT